MCGLKKGKTKKKKKEEKERNLAASSFGLHNCFLFFSFTFLFFHIQVMDKIMTRVGKTLFMPCLQISVSYYLIIINPVSNKTLNYKLEKLVTLDFNLLQDWLKFISPYFRYTHNEGSDRNILKDLKDNMFIYMLYVSGYSKIIRPNVYKSGKHQVNHVWSGPSMDYSRISQTQHPWHLELVIPYHWRLTYALQDV